MREASRAVNIASEQLMLPGLAEAMLNAYAQAGEDGAPNEDVYSKLSLSFGHRHPVGEQAKLHDIAKRKVRWQQQTLKQMGLLELVPGKRARWRCTASAKRLDHAETKTILLSYSTYLGLALYAKCQDVFQALDQPIALCLTSPPYPLQRPRAYGNPTSHEFVDFITVALEPIVKNLMPGGSIALNISNDIFESASPARSLYVERTVIALHERLGLHLMDRLIWHNPCKPPGPLQWASRTRQQMNVSWEPILWFTNDPKRCFADNRRVLRPHTAKHSNLIRQGGAKRTAVYGDGAYRLKDSSFSNVTEGSIPKNTLYFPTNNQGTSQAHALRARAQLAGLPPHGATMPLELAKFLVNFMTDAAEDHLVVDPFGGWNTTGLAAELLGRRWLVTEAVAQYSAASSFRFEGFDGFDRHHELAPVA